MAISSLRGRVIDSRNDRVVFEVSGVGYEVFVSRGAIERMIQEGNGEILIQIVSVSAMYGGGETFYGFLTAEEKEVFLLFKDNIPGTGAKKAMEYVEKAAKSFPDFRRAVLEKDSKVLGAIFGFTSKTADKLIAGLKDKIGDISLGGVEKIRRAPLAADTSLSQVLNALSSLGYKNSEARAALEAVIGENGEANLSAEEIVRRALKKL